MKQSVKQVILCFSRELPITRSVFDEIERETGNLMLFPGNYPSRALFLTKQSVKQVILCPARRTVLPGLVFFIIRAREIFALAGRYKRGVIYEA